MPVTPKSPKKGKKKNDKTCSDSPIQELLARLTQLEAQVTEARQQYIESIQAPPEPEPQAHTTPAAPSTASEAASPASPSGFGRFFRRRSTDAATTPAPAAADDATCESSMVASPNSNDNDDDVTAPAPVSDPPPLLSTPRHAAAACAPTCMYPEATYIEIKETEVFIENLRRVAELVVTGENYGTSIQKKEEAAFKRAKEKWKSKQLDLILDDEDEEGQADDNNKSVDEELEDMRNDDYLQLFDLFFERNTLDLIISLLTGTAFQLTEEEKKEIDGEVVDSPALDESNHEAKKEDDDGDLQQPGVLLPKKPKRSEELAKCRRLPQFEIATQALQSVSILIQNVSKATSLYVILSNNRINELINLPLDLYLTAERQRQLSLGNEILPMTFASSEISELTTHFVTFLKSLALRMNAQTLQFFLKYPTEVGGGETASNSHFSYRGHDGCNHDVDPEDGDVVDEEGSPAKGPAASAASTAAPSSLASFQVEFPLYERALEFCSAHQDSFVRVTAMNICLNTLRLATVSPPEEELHLIEEDSISNTHPSSPRSISNVHVTSSPRSPSSASILGSSPDADLHNAKPLPFRERLAIAQFCCIPSRVENLVSPIFTKLAERWNSLDEQIREIDSNCLNNNNNRSFSDSFSNLDKLAQAKEKVRRERLVRVFKDRAADLQDELMLLEDVFKVGLTVLNEQVIEMTLATFAYPFLLQPMLLYYQRLSAALENSSVVDASEEHPLGGYAGDLSAAQESLAPASGPAKAALFSLGCVFEFLSNKPLLRLLCTALLHPLSPDTTGVPTLRSTLEVATISRHGRKSIRLDRQTPGINGGRSTYSFGTSPGNRRVSNAEKVDYSVIHEGGEACVFVLSPALAEVLEFSGDDISLIARTRPNPYRRALLKFLEGPDAISHVRELAVGTFDSAVKALDARFTNDVVFGTSLKSFSDDVPLDERTLDSINAHSQDDRGIGGSSSQESRTSLARQKGGTVGSDLLADVISSLSRSVLVTARSQSASEWKLEYDDIASHSLLSIVRSNARSMQLASQKVEQLRRQAASFITSMTSKIHSPMGGSSILMEGCPSVNSPDYEQQVEGAMINFIFYDIMGPDDTMAVIPSELLQLQLHGPDTNRDGYSVGVSCECSFDALCTRVGRLPLEGVEGEGHSFLSDKDEVRVARSCVSALLKVDALVTLLKDMATTGGRVFEDTAPAGLALSAEGMVVSMKDCFESNLSKQVYAPLSAKMSGILFCEGPGGRLAETGSSIDLSGKPLLPCVCEAPASLAYLFSGEGLGVVSEGVTWQSLYLVFTDGCLIVAQPLPDGDGRVITSCYLERLSARLDTHCLADDGPPARRLMLSHRWFDSRPPTLFLFDELPQDEKVGPLTRVKCFTSTLDVWFEDKVAADHAQRVLSSQIFSAKSRRGESVKYVLSPETTTTEQS